MTLNGKQAKSYCFMQSLLEWSILKNGLIFPITVLTPASATIVSAKVHITEISSITALILRSVFGVMRHSDLSIFLLSESGGRSRW